MKVPVHYDYATASAAINYLREEGFNVDFNLPEILQKFESGEWHPQDFRIIGVYRYEGDSDPGDEMVVYAIESNSGIRGIFVGGFGISSDRKTNNFITQIPIQ